MGVRVTLTVGEGPAAGLSLAAKPLPLLLGRSPDADLRLDDPRVSQAHAQLVAEGDAVIVVDLAGRTFVNGQRVSRARLAEGDRITLGGSEIVVSLTGATGSAKIPAAPTRPLEPGIPTPASGLTLPLAEPARPTPVKGGTVEEFEVCHLGDPSYEAPLRGRSVFVLPPRLSGVRLRFNANPTFALDNGAGVLYAVVDGAQNLDLAFAAKRAGYDPISLFVGERAAQLGQVAPYFFPVPRGAPYFEEWTAALGSHAGVLVDSPADPRVLFTHLRSVFVVQDETGQEYFFRYYDPRVLRKYLPTCTEAELVEFFGPARAWICEDEAATGYLAFTRTAAGQLRQDKLGMIEVTSA